MSKVLLLFISLLALVCSSCYSQTKAKDAIYLIPKDYIGDVIIVFNQVDGVVPKIENGSFVYQIPENGILKVKAERDRDLPEQRYFYDKDGVRSEIQQLRVTGDNDINGRPKDKFDGQVNESDFKNRVYIINPGRLGTFKNKKEVIEFTSFVVGTPKESERLHEAMQKRIIDMQQEYLKSN